MYVDRPTDPTSPTNSVAYQRGSFDAPEHITSNVAVHAYSMPPVPPAPEQWSKAGSVCTRVELDGERRWWGWHRHECDALLSYNPDCSTAGTMNVHQAPWWHPAGFFTTDSDDANAGGDLDFHVHVHCAGGCNSSQRVIEWLQYRENGRCVGFIGEAVCWQAVASYGKLMGWWGATAAARQCCSFFSLPIWL